MHDVFFAVFGLLAVSSLLLFFVVRSFQKKREGWRAFAERHGLEVTGLGFNETPTIRGTWRGVSVSAELNSAMSMFRGRVIEASLTVVEAVSSSPLPWDVAVTDAADGSELAVPLPSRGPQYLAVYAAGPAAREWLQDENVVRAAGNLVTTYEPFVTIERDHVSVARSELADPQELQAMLDDCVDALVTFGVNVRHHTEGDNSTFLDQRTHQHLLAS